MQKSSNNFSCLFVHSPKGISFVFKFLASVFAFLPPGGKLIVLNILREYLERSPNELLQPPALKFSNIVGWNTIQKHFEVSPFSTNLIFNVNI